MSYRRMTLLASLAFAVTVPLGAQDAEQTIDPGMTRDEVVEHLGKPLNERKTGNAWFMFYRNGCERTCGMNDLVILEDGKVVDALFRSPSRHYSAASSSPTGVRPEPTAGDGGGTSAVNRVRKAGRGGLVIASPSEQPASGGERATVTGVEVNAAPMQPRNTGTSGNAPSPTTFGGSAGGNAPQVTSGGGNAPQIGSPEAAAAAPRAAAQRPVMPVPLPGAKINPADSVRALTPDRPTAIPGAKVNPADSARAEEIRKQQSDTTRKPD
jgi:hypothetical protein